MNKVIKSLCLKSSVQAVVTGLVLCGLMGFLGCVLCSAPSWSPDSSQVALLCALPQDDPNQFRLVTYDVAAGRHRIIDEVAGKGVLSAPAWSPDGQWIAYYRVMPAPADPNQPISAPLTEDNALIPGFLFDIAKTQWEAPDPNKTFNVELVLTHPDGSQAKTLRTMPWPDSKDGLNQLTVLSPTWSKDASRLFYTYPIDDLFMIVEIEVATGHTRACALSSVGMARISPDDRWIATLLEDQSKQWLVELTRLDGSMQKSVRIPLHPDSASNVVLFGGLSWSADGLSVLVASDKQCLIVNTVTGQTRAYQDPGIKEIAYAVQAPQGEQVYYLAGLEKADPNADTEPVELRRGDLSTGRVQTLLRLTDVPGVEDVGRLSVAPSGKTVLVRCTTGLLIWDGQTSRVVETAPWMTEPWRKQ